MVEIVEILCSHWLNLTRLALSGFHAWKGSIIMYWGVFRPKAPSRELVQQYHDLGPLHCSTVYCLVVTEVQTWTGAPRPGG